MLKIRFAAAACAFALLIAGCSSSSTGTGAVSTTSSTSSTASTTHSSTPAQSGHDNSALTPAQLDSVVLPAVLAKKTFHIKGSGTDGSGGALSFDIHYGNNGSSGTVGIMGTSLKLLVIGSDAYMFGTAAFWQAALAGQSTQQVTVATVAGKWVKVNASGADFKDLFDLMDAKKFLTQTQNDTSTVHKIGNTTYQGQQAVEFKDSSDGSQIFIQRFGDPLPIAITSPTTSSGGGGTFSFSAYGQPYTVASPPAGQIVDITPFLH